MEITISIRCDNEAFEGENCGSEVARILRKLADAIDYDHREGVAAIGNAPLMDVNGNTVGKVTVL